MTYNEQQHLTNQYDKQKRAITVAGLTDETTGRWLVETQAGTQHLFDLDADTYLRTSQQLERILPFDGEPRELLDVDRWPRIHDTFQIVAGDPDNDDAVFTQTSSYVRRIMPFAADGNCSLPAMSLQEELTQLPPTNAWLVLGSEASMPTPAELHDMRHPDDPDLLIWTASRNTRRGDLILLYFTDPTKAILYAARAASDAFYDDTLEMNAVRPVDPHQWWVELGPFVAINPIPIQTLRAAMGGHLILRGRPTHYLPPRAIETLFPATGLTAEQAAVLQIPVGDAALPDPATMTFEQWRSLSAGLLKLEAEVERYVVDFLLHTLTGGEAEWGIQRQYQIPGTRLKPDHVIFADDRPAAVVEVKLGIRQGYAGDWSTSPDYQQVTLYANKLGVPAILIDSNRIFLIEPGDNAPWTWIDRTDATNEDLATIRHHISRTTREPA